MRVALQKHPRSRGAAIQTIDVDFNRDERGFVARYHLLGRLSEVKLPPARPSGRADDLWRTTCFEAFLATADGGYHELNFSPSTEWAVYRFDGYRAGMRPSEELGNPRIEVHNGGDGYELAAFFGAPRNATRFGLSAILEDRDGTKSYWALAHREGEPDFHDIASFALDLSELR